MSCLYWLRSILEDVLERILNLLIKVGLVNKNPSARILEYCKSLIGTNFYGQTSKGGDTDYNLSDGDLNLGSLLSLMDEFIRNCPVDDFTGTELKYIQYLKLVAAKRKKIKEGETIEVCFTRLQKENKSFVEIYHERKEISQEISHKREYWGTRQQLLSGKVIADWVDPKRPIDPIFGVLFNPTAGMVGPGEANIIHEALFDNNGSMAHHSAVHDGFGYLKTKHDIGPGYDYFDQSVLSEENPLAGQASGVTVWRQLLDRTPSNIEIIC